MKNYNRILVLILICSLSGCAWWKGKAVQPRKIPAQKEIGNVVRPDLLRKGGKLLIIPFKAGVNVEATDELDVVALRIVKGMADILREANAPFEVLTADNASEAEFVFKGHIIQKKKTSGLKKALFFKQEILLEVEGQMFDERNNKIILYVKDQARTKSRKRNFQDLGEEVGRHIGQFILSGMTLP